MITVTDEDDMTSLGLGGCTLTLTKIPVSSTEIAQSDVAVRLAAQQL